MGNGSSSSSRNNKRQHAIFIVICYFMKNSIIRSLLCTKNRKKKGLGLSMRNATITISLKFDTYSNAMKKKPLKTEDLGNLICHRYCCTVLSFYYQFYSRILSHILIFISNKTEKFSFCRIL